ncbi:MAG: HD domain-containing protein [Desulfurococcaceae archaeon]|jgi:uncharacterized protein|nr:HD domain-containing protein [Desulfurococcaceae archaeon]
MLVGSRTRIVDLVEELVMKLYPRDMVHCLDHVLRVRDLALRIGEEVPELVDREVLELAVLLHDIGRISGDEGYARRSAEIARIILELANHSRDRIERVVETIQVHSFSEGFKPVSIEAKVLSDADKLDALRAIGVARIFAFSGAKGRSLDLDIVERVSAWRTPFRVSLELGDGRVVEAEICAAIVCIEDMCAPTLVASFRGAKNVIGVRALEDLGLAVDPAGKRFVPVRPPNTAYFYTLQSS